MFRKKVCNIMKLSISVHCSAEALGKTEGINEADFHHHSQDVVRLSLLLAGPSALLTPDVQQSIAGHLHDFGKKLALIKFCKKMACHFFRI